MTGAEVYRRRARTPAVLKRQVFTISRLAEFCTRGGLERQTGQSAEIWPIYAAKELIDNALDNCEETRTAPSIAIELGADRITVSDNGSGIPAETVERLLDLGSRTSSRSHFIGPTRGAQGQALSTVFVMAHALAPGCGRAVVIEAQGLAHRVAVQIDRLSREPKLVREVSSGSVKIGTKVTVEWPESACTILEEAMEEILPLAMAYVVTNPHLDLSVRMGAKEFCSAAVDPGWEKWRPDAPPSPHWFGVETFGRLIQAQIKSDREKRHCRALRDFLEEFDGLSGTSKRGKVLRTAGLYRASLEDLLRDDEIDAVAVRVLLSAMQAETRPIRPARLGIIGEANLRRVLAEEGRGQGFVYAKATGFDGVGFPYVVEGTFTWNPKRAKRQLIAGANFASTPTLSFELNLWETADSLLSRRYAGDREPICVFLHVVHPRFTFTDLGKTRISLPPAVATDLRGVIEKVTGAWERQRRRETKSAKAELRRHDALERRRKLTVKESVYKHLPAVYVKWAGNIGAVCRQLFYGLRPLVLADTGRTELKDEYIQYTLIPDFIAEHPDICATWTVLYDDRGHLIEPHRGRSIGLGTRSVRDYCRGWGKPEVFDFGLGPPRVQTYGPSGRYGGIHFCEKEGFNELFQKHGLDARYDVALASTKGTSVTAARELFEKAGQQDIPIFALVDFDYNGFEIAATLSRDTRRYRFAKPPRVIVIGLRLADVKRLKLEPEPVSFGRRSLDKIRKNLRRNGATEEEIEYLVDGQQRVELNAVPTPALIEMIEKAFAKHGVKKIIPEQDVLAQHFNKEFEYRQARKAIQEVIRKARAEVGEIAIPTDLREQVGAFLRKNPTGSWDAAIRAIVRGDCHDHRGLAQADRRVSAVYSGCTPRQDRRRVRASRRRRARRPLRPAITTRRVRLRRRRRLHVTRLRRSARDGPDPAEANQGLSGGQKLSGQLSRRRT
jgi:DNA topoisomerase VI subunit B